jgi:hypothetical protein
MCSTGHLWKNAGCPLHPLMSNANGFRKSDAGSIGRADGWQLSPEGRQARAFQMNRATKGMRNFAKRLTAYETLENKPSETTKPTVFPESEKLRPYLSTLMGAGGFRALLSRALALAAVEVSWLHAVQVKADGTLEGWQAAHGKIVSDEFYEGRVVLLAQLLGLMAAFIGEILTLRLVREVWPKIPLNDLDFSKEGKK